MLLKLYIPQTIFFNWRCNPIFLTAVTALHLAMGCGGVGDCLSMWDSRTSYHQPDELSYNYCNLLNPMILFNHFLSSSSPLVSKLLSYCPLLLLISTHSQGGGDLEYLQIGFYAPFPHQCEGWGDRIWAQNSTGQQYYFIILLPTRFRLVLLLSITIPLNKPNILLYYTFLHTYLLIPSCWFPTKYFFE